MKPTLTVKDVDKGMRAFMGKMRAIKGTTSVKIGWLADDDRGGLHVEGGDLTVAELAAVMEYGTEDQHVPARPALRPTFDAMREELAGDLRTLLFKVLWGDLSPEKAFGIVGLKLATAVRKFITTSPLPGIPPPNAPLTALLKAQRTGAIRGGKKKSLGGQLADIAATEGMLQAIGKSQGRKVGWTWGKLGPLKAAQNLSQAFAQIGALASVRTWVDTGQLLRALTWAVSRDRSGSAVSSLTPGG